jgi:D-xylose reductase
VFRLKTQGHLNLAFRAAYIVGKGQEILSSLGKILEDMVAERFCRASINTARSFTFVARPSNPFLPPIRTCKSRPNTCIPRLTFAKRNFFATMAIETPYVTLNDGNKMPQVGFGLWKVDNDTCADTVYNAIKTGYRLFDGACGMYNFPRV